MANDWSTPVDSTAYTSVLAALNNKIVSAAKQDYTGDTNIPSGVLAFNITTGEVTQYNGSSWVSVLGCYKPGDIKMTFASTPDSGFLMLNGDTIGDASSGATRANAAYANLFAALWNNLANTEAPVSTGRGASAAADFAAHKTITMPNATQKVPVYVGSATAINAPGKSTGSIDHAHTTPNHQHTIAAHQHDLASHAHLGPSHQHAGPSHYHLTKAHYHSTQGAGADINTTAGGSHGHNTQGGNFAYTGAHDTSNRVANTNSGRTPTTDAGPIVAATHVHAHSEFSGSVGNVTSGVNGDLAFATEYEGTGLTGFAGNANTGFPSPNTSDPSTAFLTSTSEGGSTTGINNGPMLAMYFQIKT